MVSAPNAPKRSGRGRERPPIKVLRASGQPHQQARPSKTFLVVGASGKTGRRVAARLADTYNVRAASRSGEVRFDWEDAATYAAAVAGADGIFLTVPGQSSDAPRRVAALLDVAAGSGVGVAVLLSARAVEFHPGGALAQVEAAVRDGVPGHAILRTSWFAQNFTEGFLTPDEHGIVSAPTGDGREPLIDLEDVAEVAVAALTEPHVRGTINLSGSEAVSFAEAVDLVSHATGRPARFEPADPDDYRSAIASQLPPEYVAWRMAMFDAIRTGRDTYLSAGVQDALGRPARSFSEWAQSDGPAMTRLQLS